MTEGFHPSTTGTSLVATRLFQGRFPVRSVWIGGVQWFVGKDIAERLGYADAARALNQHCKSLKKLNSAKMAELGFDAPPPSGMLFVSKPDVARLIAGSHLPEAVAFEKWLFEDAAVTALETGHYRVQPETREQLLARALLVSAEMLREKDVAIAEMTPKAEVYDAVMDTSGTLDISTVAKTVGKDPGKYHLHLEKRGWIYRNHHGRWTAYADKVKAGWLVHKLHRERNRVMHSSVRVTVAGMAKLAELDACDDLRRLSIAMS